MALTRRQRGCLWAALGGIVLCAIVVVALVAGAGWLVYQSSSIRQTKPTPEQAGSEIDRVRATFGGPPLVTLAPDGEPQVTMRDGHGKMPETLHLLMWQPGTRELTHVTLPFWVVRVGGQKARFRVGEQKTIEELSELKVTTADIERAGPGPLFDHTDRDGKVTLIWTE
jgi:hypothetical protein